MKSICRSRNLGTIFRDQESDVNLKFQLGEGKKNVIIKTVSTDNSKLIYQNMEVARVIVKIEVLFKKIYEDKRKKSKICLPGIFLV